MTKRQHDEKPELKRQSIAEAAHRLYEPGVPFEIPIPEESLFRLLQDAGTRYPRVVAIDCFGHTATYAKILSQAKRAAQALVDLGVKRGDVVAIALPNCPQAFVAFYACQRIGAIAAQHNPLATAPELAAQFKRHKAKVAIAWESTVERLPLDGDNPLETVLSVNIAAQMPRRNRILLALPVKAARTKRAELRARVPDTVQSWDKLLKSSGAIPEDYPHAEVDDVAVILHTGGTNGVPKSVPLTHRNLGANVNQCLFWVFKLHEGSEVFFSLLPYFHAFGLTFFLLAAVKKAATQVVLPKFDVEMALEAYRRRPVTFFVGVPPMFERFAKGALETGTDISTIAYAVSGAMPLSEKVAHLWQSASHGVILEGYGLSETSPVISGSPLSPKRRLGTLGLPFPSTRVRLVDPEDPATDVADGQPGEIIVQGPQVFAGYLDAPEENESAFTADGWFRTGDIARNEDGYLFLADRRKELILSGGFNVYPSQVEEILRTFPGVKDVAVVGMPTDDDREAVAAALVMEEGQPEPTLEEIRSFSRDKVSAYALPKQIAYLAELPRNQLGKVLRRVVKEQLLDPMSKMVGEASRAATDLAIEVGDLVTEVGDVVGEVVGEAFSSKRGDDEARQDRGGTQQ